MKLATIVILVIVMAMSCTLPSIQDEPDNEQEGWEEIIYPPAITRAIQRAQKEEMNDEKVAFNYDSHWLWYCSYCV